MSQDNLDLHHRVVDAFNRRDLDALLALCDRDVRFFTRILELEGGGPFEGHDGVGRWWHDLLSVSPDFSVEIEDVREVGDLTIARHRHRGHGSGSNAPIEQTAWQVTEWRNGKAVWGCFVRSEAEAVEAVRVRGP